MHRERRVSGDDGSSRCVPQRPRLPHNLSCRRAWTRSRTLFSTISTAQEGWRTSGYLYRLNPFPPFPIVAFKP